MKHVFLGSLPIGTDFLHKHFSYRKVDAEHARDMEGKVWVMEPHYGAVITLTQYKELGLIAKDEIKE